LRLSLRTKGARELTDVQFYQAGRPWKKTGTLKRSIKEDVRREGTGVRAAVGSGLIYARIHEYGGQAGRGHAVTIPMREYLRPALKAKEREIFELVAGRFAKLLRKLK